LKAGSPELAETAEKTRARALARRREMLRAMDGPPMFGARFSGDGWHRALDARAAQPGFEKPLSEEAALDRLLAELASGANPWTAVVDRAGLLEPPYLSAALPDPALLGRQRRAKEERLAAAASRLASGYGLPPAQALERYQAEAASATAVLDALAARAEKPSFLREPPLELDALRWSEGRLPSGPRLVRTEFDTPFTNLSVAFDLGAVPRPDWELLPLLEAALGGVGVVTASGERLDYAQAAERRMAEIYGAGVGAVAHPRRDRAELVFAAHASSEEEVGRAAAWLESYLLRPNLSEDSRERLVDSLRASIQGWRGVFQADEESWVAGAAAAYEHQDRPLYMHLSSPFTVLRHLNRLRWRLEKPAPAELAVLRATATAALAAADGAERGQAAVLLEGVAGELGEYLRWELSHLPEDSWRRDLRRLATELLEDVGRPEETIARLRALAKRVLVRAGARVHLNGSPRSLDRALPLVDRLIARLPAGRRAPPAKRQGLVAERLNERLPGLERPVHVALVNNGGKTGTVSVWAKGPGYRSRSREDLLDALAFGVLGGGGAHSLFIRTWGAGLAYGNGMSHRAWSGRVSYYADKCPDPAQTLRFVGDVAASTAIDDPFLLEYSLSGAFGDFRGLGDFTGRGSALAYDLEEGNRPELVRAYKARLLALARAPGTLEAVRARFKSALGRVLVGLPGGKVAASPEAGAFLIGPDDLIEKYEAFVKERGEAERVIRLYPRDFWP
ncbi:MAG: hypothetical protein HY554_02700, partial [Elusimicrobia bacterium]|nr:hypothetical protein [Elusimicrobiota bacterium]